MYDSTKSSSSAIALLSLLLMLCCSIGYCAQPSYQVSLYVQLHPKGAPIHYCNGVIVQSRLILTAATCTYYQQTPDAAPIQITPDMLSVVAGVNNNALHELNTFRVQQFEIASGFDRTTLAHDLALLRLDGFLPLGARQDINWIILDEYDDAQLDKQTVQASFPSLNWRAEYAQIKSLPTVESTHCAADICTQYPGHVPAHDSQALFYFPAFNGDRGIGLLNKAHLIGIFSRVAPSAGAANNCTSQQARYTSLNAHLDWIYEVIANDVLNTLEDDSIVYSAPYQGQETVGAIRQMFETVKTVDSTSTDASTINFHYQALVNAAHGTVPVMKCSSLLIVFIALYTLLYTYNS